MVGFIIIGTVCVSLILTGSLPGIAYLMPYSAPLSTDGIYGRAAGVSFLLGFFRCWWHHNFYTFNDGWSGTVDNRLA